MYNRNILIEQTDPELYAAILQENARQEHHIELIASENYASPAVMAAQGSQLTNKYAEGYPGKRYYGGCEYVDIAEQLAIDRVKQIFGAEAANVQPHCGASANEAVFLAPCADFPANHNRNDAARCGVLLRYQRLPRGRIAAVPAYNSGFHRCWSESSVPANRETSEPVPVVCDIHY